MGSRRPAAALAAFLAVLILAACSAGVPPTGKVVTVTPVPPPPPPEQAAAEGSGPRPGSTETEVAQGYMYAMSSGDSKQVARWVVPGKRSQVEHWSSRTPINVYDSFEPRLPTLSQGHRIVSIQVKRIGRLEDGRDWTPDTQDVTVDLELRRVGVEWRVANPDEQWIDDANFKRLYSPVEVFMVAGDRQHLAAVPVFVPRSPVGTNSMAALEHRADAALRVLLAGPQGRVADALVTAIPPGTALNRFSYRDGVATVDLSGRFSAADGLDGRLRVGQIVWTVTRLIQTAQVRILVDGGQPGAVGADRFPVGRDRPWQRTVPLLAGLWPQRPTVAGSERVLFVRKGEIYAVRPEPNQPAALMAFEAAGSTKSTPSWSPNGRRIAFLVTNGNEQSLWVGEPGDPKAAPPGVRGRRLSAPSWSPDANRIYILSQSQDTSRPRLNIVDLVNWSVTNVVLAPLPGDLQPTLLEVSPDGAFVLAIGAERSTQPPDGGQLFLGPLGPAGVTSWFSRPIAPGLGTVYSPVWVDPLTVAFIAKTGAKDDLGKLWLMEFDGWDPTPVLNVDPTNESTVDLGDQLTVDPAGANFIFTVASEDGTSLWMVDRQGNGLRPLTVPLPNDFATDPSFASR